MVALAPTSLAQAKALIFRQGRLLDRQLYRYGFESGSRDACFKALLAYQNEDGGFGNGIEPDLLCPDSSAIGAETALYVMDLLNDQPADVVLPLLDWLTAHQLPSGGLAHPPPTLAAYPAQPWWQGGDEERVLSIAAYLAPWQSAKPEFFAGAQRYYNTHYRAATSSPTVSYYSYPLLTYLVLYQQDEADTTLLKDLQGQLPAMLAANADHFPLFSRAWYRLQSLASPSTIAQGAEAVMTALAAEEGVPNPYPDLPWWQPIFTLDHLLLLQRGGYL